MRPILYCTDCKFSSKIHSITFIKHKYIGRFRGIKCKKFKCWFIETIEAPEFCFEFPNSRKKTEYEQRLDNAILSEQFIH